ncbi:DinB family protein [Oryzobacter telluris]|uniref:DinB family protein n=1 Tax=Oryzobacter telluris TaxID=3149179 RepID=UPI00370D5064
MSLTQVGEDVDTALRALRTELDRAWETFFALAKQAKRSDLDQRTNGSRWTNGPLLFHMLLGYLVVRTLLPLVRFLGRRPPVVGRRLSGALNTGTRPFHAVNYLGACVGALAFRGPRLPRQVDRTIAAPHRGLDGEDEGSLALRMPFPARCDPFLHRLDDRPRR